MIYKTTNHIPNLQLTLDDYFNLRSKEAFKQGGEGAIYKNDNPNSLYKLFIDQKTGLYIDMPSNKLEKLVYLYNTNPKNMIKVLSTISVNDSIIGYEMSYDVATIRFTDAILDYDEKLEVLSQTAKVLQYFATMDITYGDIKGNNILINYRTGEVEFCDIDNIRIGRYPIDLVVKYLHHFSTKYGKINSVADAYMHNIFTLQQLDFPFFQPTYANVVEAIEMGVFPDITSNKAIEILESMKKPENFTGEYVIEYIKK